MARKSQLFFLTFLYNQAGNTPLPSHAQRRVSDSTIQGKQAQTRQTYMPVHVGNKKIIQYMPDAFRRAEGAKLPTTGYLWQTRAAKCLAIDARLSSFHRALQVPLTTKIYVFTPKSNAALARPKQHPIIVTLIFAAQDASLATSTKTPHGAYGDRHLLQATGNYSKGNA